MGAVGEGSTVTFDVRGQLFKVLRQSVTQRPSTLLAQLVENMQGDEHVFIDASAERFSHILDWYTYGEMFASSGISERAVLRDCCFFL